MNADLRCNLTTEAIEHPLKGDLFTEMFSYWLLVTTVNENGVYIEHKPTHDNDKSFMTFSEYKTYMYYNTMPMKS